MPYFSIVIPVYNVEPYLRECLDSLLSQTFIDWEAICVDDGSTDGSGAILDEYAAKDKRFRVVHQKNSGVSVARNVGIELSDSKWIGFLDPDDALDFRWLEIAAQGTILDVDVVRMEPTFWSDGMVQPKVSYKCSKIIIEGHEAVSLWGWRIMTKSGWAWASFWSRRLIDAVKPRFPVGIKYSEDSLFNLSCIGMVKRVAYIPFYGYYYRMRTSSACNSNRDVDERIAFYEAYQEILRKFPLQNFSSNSVREINKQALYFAWANLIVWAIHPMDKKGKNKIRLCLRHIMKCQGWRVGDLPFHWRTAGWLFLRMGLIFPIQVSRWFICVMSHFIKMVVANCKRITGKCYTNSIVV